MKLYIEHQESYSRGELLLRTFFGLFYILIPHGFALFFYAIYVYFAMIIAWFSILFTKKYPKFAFDAITGLYNWQTRLNASMSNMVDGYPPFGPSTKWEKAYFEISYPEMVTRKRLLFASFFGFLVLIPHFFVLMAYSMVAAFAMFFAWFAVLFTGKYPESLHGWNVNYNRFSMRINMYSMFLYYKYPEFTGEETEIDKLHA